MGLWTWRVTFRNGWPIGLAWITIPVHLPPTLWDRTRGNIASGGAVHGRTRVSTGCARSVEPGTFQRTRAAALVFGARAMRGRKKRCLSSLERDYSGQSQFFCHELFDKRRIGFTDFHRFVLLLVSSLPHCLNNIGRDSRPYYERDLVIPFADENLTAICDELQ